uniref:Microtubule-associated protein 4 n=1 Tax=Serinus canaria TaxID=9135 RepID=A0A8C9MRA8_SERCA
MADLDHSLSLADALTEPPPDVEEEVKRDFIATLEAEKFDDVVGETVDKTDYVPLLDDEDQARNSGVSCLFQPLLSLLCTPHLGLLEQNSFPSSMARGGCSFLFLLWRLVFPFFGRAGEQSGA